MSIQDNIFDIQEALEGTPEEKIFEELCQYLYALEEDHSAQAEALENIRKGMNSLKHLLDTA